ncbi:MAG TPA: class I SAM-dependent methyltransferase, partial [Flavisolibacter sp.]
MNVFKRIKRHLAIKFSFAKDPTKRIISFWEKGGPDFDYFKNADQQDWLNVFWSSESKFLQYFRHLQLDTTLEIACGTGRHSAQMIHKIKKLYLLDSSLGALNLARERFAGNTNVTYIHNKDGMGIPGIVPDNSL